MSAHAFPLLSALLSPLPAGTFLERHWPRTPCVAHGDPQRLPAVFHDASLTSAAEFARGYRGRVRFTHGGSERMLQSADVDAASLLDMGLTVQFVDAARGLPGAVPFMRHLEAELGLHEGAISMSAFASPCDDGLNRHFDAAELISVQLQGAKDFHHAPVVEIPAPSGGQYAPRAAPFDELYPQAINGFPEPDAARFALAPMTPGSVLFLPRGTWHYTQAREPSLSISIVVDPPAALRCLLDQLRLLLLQDPEWRQPLAGGFGGGDRDAQARAHVASLLAGLPAKLARLTPDDILAAPAGVGWRIARIVPQTRFQRAPHARLALGTVDANGRVPVSFYVGRTQHLTLDVGQLEVSPGTVPLLRWLEGRTEGPFTAADLHAAFAQEPFAAVREVLGLCVQTQFLRLLWFPALSVGH